MHSLISFCARPKPVISSNWPVNIRIQQHHDTHTWAYTPSIFTHSPWERYGRHWLIPCLFMPGQAGSKPCACANKSDCLQTGDRGVFPAPRKRKLRQGQDVNRTSSGISIRISGLILIHTRMSAASRPKCCASIALSASVISPSFVKVGVWLYIWEIMVSNLLKIPYSETWWKWKSSLEFTCRSGSTPRT